MATRTLTWNFVAKDNASKTVDQMHKRIGVLGVAIGSALGGIAKDGVEALGGAMVQGFKDAVNYQTLGLKTAAVIKSTGNVAHISVKGIQALAASQETLSGVDETLIINAENVLATFKNVRNEAGKGNDIFNQGTKEALNLSVALGKDLQGSTVLVGKALNDPIKGLTALGKIGVKFTDDQKKQIAAMVKSGNVMGAQKVILGQLETRYGGAAKAAGAGFAGSLAHLKDVASDAARDLVIKFLPTLTLIAKWLADKLPHAIDVVKSAFSTFIKAFKGDPTGPLTSGFAKVAIAGRILGAVFRTIIAIGKALLKFYLEHKVLVQSVAFGILAVVTAMKIWAFTMKTVAFVTKALALAQGLLNAVLDANPIGLIILALIGLAAAFVWAYRHSETFRKIVQGGLNVVMGVVKNVIHAFSNLVNAIAGTVAWVRSHWPLMLAILTGPIGVATLFIIKHWQAIKDGAVKAFNAVVTFLRSLPGKFLSAVAKWGTLLTSAGGNLLEGIHTGLVNAAKKIGGWIKSIGTTIVNAVKGFFGIHSPSTVMAGIGGNLVQGLFQGIMAANPMAMITKVFGGMPSALGALLGKGLIGIGGLTSKALGALGGLGSKVLGFLGFGGGGGGGNSHNQMIGKAMAAAFGWVGAQWEALKALWNGESGWNASAQNPTSSAYGIAQFLDGTWAGVGATKTSSAAGQIAAGLKYIAQSYGSPLAAYSAWKSRSPHWYDQGGWLQPGYTMAYNGTGQAERVLPPGDGGVNVRVFIGETELRGIVRTEVDSGIGAAARGISARRAIP